MSEDTDKTSGFIVCSILDGEGGGKTISSQQIDDWSPRDGILWLHLNYSKADVQEWFRKKSGLSRIACDALMADDTRPRIIDIDEGLLITLRAVNHNPEADPDDMVSVRLWLTEERIISMRHRSVKAINDLHEALDKKEGPVNTGDFLVMLVNQTTNRIAETGNDIEDGVDDLEEQTIERKWSELRSKLSTYRRMIIGLRRYIVPQREVMMHLQSEKTSWLSETDRMHLRELAERTIRIIEDLDAARDRAAILQEELNSRLSEQMNRTIYIMSIVATIFLPLSLITSLLGINVGGIPGAQTPWAFSVVCVILAVIAVVEYFLFRKKRML